MRMVYYAISAIFGGIIGFAVCRIFGCDGGGSIISNVWSSILLGAVLCILICIPFIERDKSGEGS